MSILVKNIDIVSFGVVLRFVRGILHILVVQDDPNQSANPWKEENSKYKLPGGDGEITLSIRRETHLDAKFLLVENNLLHSIDYPTHLKNFYLLLSRDGEIKIGGGIRKASFIPVKDVKKMIETNQFLPDHEESLIILLEELEKFHQGRAGVLKKHFDVLYK